MTNEHRIDELEKEIADLEKEHKIKGGDHRATEAKFQINMMSHDKMVQGPWQHMGIAIDAIMERTLVRWKNSYIDFDAEMTTGEAIAMAKRFCCGFFDSWEKEINELYEEHLLEVKRNIMDHVGEKRVEFKA